MDTDMNHYCSKAAIARSIVEGIPAKALCGELVDCSHQGADAIPGNEEASRALPVCRECELHYELMGIRERRRDNLDAELNSFLDQLRKEDA